MDIDVITLEKDGLKKVDHIIIPTYEWLDYIRDMDESSLDAYTNGIYFLGQGDVFYKYLFGTIQEVTL